MKKSVKKLIFAGIILMLLGLIPAGLYSAETDSIAQVEEVGLLMKLGIGGNSDHVGYIFDFGINFGRYETIIFYRTGTKSGDGFFVSNDPPQILNTAGLAYLLSVKNGLLYFNIGSGLGIFWGTLHKKLIRSGGESFRVNYWESEEVLTPCFPLMLELGLKLWVFTLTGKYEFIFNIKQPYQFGSFNIGIVL